MSEKNTKRSSTDAKPKVRIFRSQRDESIFYKKLFVISCAVFGLSVVFYLSSVNSMASKGNEMRAIEKIMNQENEGIAKLEIREAELRSLYQIKEDTSGLESIQPTEVSYVQNAGSVAMNR